MVVNKESYTSASAFPSKLLHINPIDHGKIKPIHAQLILTNECNLNCGFCSYADRDKKKKLKLEQVIDIIDVLYKHGCKSCTLTGGGETLMYSNINETIDYLSLNGIKAGLVTNGKLLDRLKYHDNLTWCRISSSDDRVPSYDKISYALEMNPKTDWAFSHVVTKEPNYETIRGLVDFANKNKFTHIRLVSDLLDLDNVPNLDIVKNHLKRTGIDDHLVIYQGRKDSTKGTKNCYISLLKPMISPEGIMPCCVDENERTIIKRDNNVLSIPLKDVIIGDICIIGNNSEGKVINIFNKIVNDPIEIILRGGRSIRVSKDHTMFKVDKISHKLHEKIVKNVTIKEIKSSDLKIGDLLPVVTKINTYSNKEMDLEWARLLGYYTAEGWTDMDGGITLMIGKNDKIKTDLLKCLDNQKINYKIHERRTGLQICIHLKSLNKKLRELLNKCGNRALNKKIPLEILNSEENIKLNYLWALIQGDGNIHKKKNNPSLGIIIRTCSRGLIQDLTSLFDSLGLYSSSNKQKREGESYIEGRKVYIHDIYSFRVSSYNSLEKFKIFGLDLWYAKHKRNVGLRFPTNKEIQFIQIMKIENAKPGNFIDLQVSNTNSFAGGQGIIVHNCGVVYAIKGQERKHIDRMKMGNLEDLDEILTKQKYFDGSICTTCYYEEYNLALSKFLNKPDHSEFV